MEPEAYFERVLRFLETKGWNTSTSKLNETTRVVTGTRESDTYYDRMLTMVAIDEESTLTGEHIEFLREAATEHDVDQMMATCRGGLDDEARRLCDDHGIEFIELGRIDDAFIDGFSLEESTLSGPDEVVESVQIESIRRDTLSLVGFYLLFAAGIATMLVTLQVLATDPGSVSRLLLFGTVVLASPLLPAVWVGVADRQSPVTVFLGAAAGHLLLLGVLWATVLGVGMADSTQFLSSIQNFAVLAVLALPVGALGAGSVLLATRSTTGEED